MTLPHFSPSSSPPPYAFREKIALFLDIDGTLAPLAATPHEVEIAAGTLQHIKTISDLTDGAVAFVSGRNIADIDRLCGTGYSVAGQHGLEIRSMGHGAIILEDLDKNALAALTLISAELEKLQQEHRDLLLEFKGRSFAVHYRANPDLESVVEQRLESLRQAHPEHLAIQRGKMVAELRPRGGGKGHAIRNFMNHPPFRGRIPIFAGDDLTDEDGFIAVNEMNGISVKIGEGQTVARYHLAGVDELSEWITHLASHLKQDEKP